MGSSGAGGDYEIERSLRFNDADSPELSRTPGSAGNRRTYTISVWIKIFQKASGHTYRAIIGAGGGSTRDRLQIFNDNKLVFNLNDSTDAYLRTTRVLRDPAAWYHIVVGVDTTQGTASNRIKLYVNGVQETSFTNSSYPTQNYDCRLNNNIETFIGQSSSDNLYFNGYMAEFHFIDGTQLDPSSFGETHADTAAWVPKKYAGSYGSQGWYLNFSDNSDVTAATLGKDSSGNGNNWTPANLSVSSDFSTNDSFVDTPTANYATLNPLQGRGTDSGESGTLPTFTQGNLYVSGGQTNDRIRGTIGLKLGDVGKYYFEIKAVGTPGGSNCIGLQDEYNKPSTQAAGYLAHWSYSSGNDLPYKESGSNPGWTAGDILGVAINTGTSKVTWYKNNTSAGVSDLSSSSMEYVFPYIQANSGIAFAANFGGNGSFNYTPPADHVPITTQNLPTPTVLNPKEHFNTVSWAGNSATSHAITGVGFQPDLVWNKGYDDGTYHHMIQDDVRGTQKFLKADAFGGESTNSSNSGLLSFDSDGFTVGYGTQAAWNLNGKNYLAYAWKESATAGFDIVSYTGNGSAGNTFSHSLGVAPDLVIIKNREADAHWLVWTSDFANTTWVPLDTASTPNNSVTDTFNSTTPTSSVVTLGDNSKVNSNSVTYIAYLWSNVPGLSKIGKYTGNGNGNGLFVYTGFKPAFVLFKRETSESWVLADNIRDPNNPRVNYMLPDLPNATATGVSYDFVSNGFKFRTTSQNVAGSVYYYIAFAEQNFKYANAE